MANQLISVAQREKNEKEAIGTFIQEFLSESSWAAYEALRSVS